MFKRHDHHPELTVGEKVADLIARFGGSWWFIGVFFAFLGIWIVINTLILIVPYDPYPFTLLNVILSCLAALQAPFIMMAANRQETRDRTRQILDLEVDMDSNSRLILLTELLCRMARKLSNDPALTNIVSEIEALHPPKNSTPDGDT